MRPIRLRRLRMRIPLGGPARWAIHSKKARSSMFLGQGEFNRFTRHRPQPSQLQHPLLLSASLGAPSSLRNQAKPCACSYLVPVHSRSTS